MLLVGDYNCIPGSNFPGITENMIVFNFSGFNQSYRQLNMMPPFDMDFFNDKEFDIKYADYILNTDEVFCNFFDMIYLLYQGFNVFILINRYDNVEIINESLLKFIQQRYGYNYQLINSVDDINEYDDSNFSILGLSNFDEDRKKYISIDPRRSEYWEMMLENYMSLKTIS